MVSVAALIAVVQAAEPTVAPEVAVDVRTDSAGSGRGAGRAVWAAGTLPHPHLELGATIAGGVAGAGWAAVMPGIA